MSNLHLVEFSDPLDFVQAMAEYDDFSMNFMLGSLLDYTDKTQTRSQARWGSPMKALFAVYRGADDQLLLTLTKHAEGFSWLIATPTHVAPSSDRDASDIRAGAQLLAEALPNFVEPSILDKVLGPEKAVDAFIEAWVAHMQTQGVCLKALEPYFRSRACCATRSTLPVPSTASAHHDVSLASGQEDVASLLPLFTQFSSHGPHPVTAEAAYGIMSEAVAARKLWVCRVQDTVAGFILAGRETRRTIAIRNVFVLPDYRGQGIAEAMVSTVTRHYLVAESFEEGKSSNSTAESIKREVCLNVGDPAVMRIYSRCGFVLSEDAQDSVTSRKGWFPTIWRGVEPDHNHASLNAPHFCDGKPRNPKAADRGIGSRS